MVLQRIAGSLHLAIVYLMSLNLKYARAHMHTHTLGGGESKRNLLLGIGSCEFGPGRVDQQAGEQGGADVADEVCRPVWGQILSS